LLGQLCAATRSRKHLTDGILRGGDVPALQMLQRKLPVAALRKQDVVEVVRDSAGEPSERLELLRERAVAGPRGHDRNAAGLNTIAPDSFGAVFGSRLPVMGHALSEAAEGRADEEEDDRELEDALTAVEIARLAVSGAATVDDSR